MFRALGKSVVVRIILLEMYLIFLLFQILLNSYNQKTKMKAIKHLKLEKLETINVKCKITLNGNNGTVLLYILLQIINIVIGM